MNLSPTVFNEIRVAQTLVIDVVYKNINGAIKKEQYRKTDNTEYTRRRQTKQKHNTIFEWHHYTQTNTNSVNKTWALDVFYWTLFVYLSFSFSPLHCLSLLGLRLLVTPWYFQTYLNIAIYKNTITSHRWHLIKRKYNPIHC